MACGVYFSVCLVLPCVCLSVCHCPCVVLISRGRVVPAHIEGGDIVLGWLVCAGAELVCSCGDWADWWAVVVCSCHVRSDLIRLFLIAAIHSWSPSNCHIPRTAYKGWLIDVGCKWRLLVSQYILITRLVSGGYYSLCNDLWWFAWLFYALFSFWNQCLENTLDVAVHFEME